MSAARLALRTSRAALALFTLTWLGCSAPALHGGGGGDQGVGDAGGGGSDLGVPNLDGFVGGDMAAVLDVQPASLQTITVAPGASTPTVAFTATLGGQPVSVGWSLDRGDVGTIDVGPAADTTFTPKGTAGGLVTVIAGFNGMTVSRQVMVKIAGTQNGPNGSPAEQGQIPTGPGDLTSGGGVGGVGGEGLGGAVNDPTATSALDNPTAGANGLAWLYPYDGTVWPRGLPAPLLMWTWTPGDADAVKIELATDSGSFSWKGTFGRPAILGASGKFIRHPIPQDIWDAATKSAGTATSSGKTDKLTVKLTVYKSGVGASGPISETWIIAPARLSGTIYYNSYGTRLAKNLGGAVGGDGKFGGAVLSIRAGDPGPKLVAGADGDDSACRTCHSVAANGARLVVQHGDNYAISSAYDLSPAGAMEQMMTTSSPEFPGLTADGTKALTSSAQLLPLPNAAAPLTTTGLTAVSTSLGTPAFSPDGKLVAFNPMSGAGVTHPKQSLMVMSFDNATNAFSNPLTVVDLSGQPAETRPGWPAFFPDGKSLVYHQQSAAGSDGNGDGALHTRKGAKAQIAWAAVSATPTVTVLNGLDAMGKSYLPKLAGAAAMNCTGDGVQVGNIDYDHGDDVDVNYEPTVNPVASGGYVWVVFTSRRMYGSVATIPPFCSDPRGVDLVQNITPKKLWVAAVDLNGTPGTDASHPAFYLPGQELLAGNSRGFWVLDPCHKDGESCDTGDQCCNGYCEPNGAGGALVCSNMPPNASCSKPQEKCSTTADCCDPTNECINGFCAQQRIP